MQRARTMLLLSAMAATLLVIAPAGCGRKTQPPPTIPEAEIEAPVPEPAAEEAASEEAPAAESVEDEAEQPAAEPADALADAQEIPKQQAPPPSFWARIFTAIKVVAIFIGKLLFVISIPLAIAGTLFGLPGSVLVLVAATLYSALHGWASPPWWVLIVIAVIALAAELAENALSFVGVKQSGAGNTTGLWVLIGGFIGAVVGGIIAPALAAIGALAGPIGWVLLSIIPPIGLGMLGGYLGGYYYELRQGKSPEEARNAGWGALAGRLAGSLTKALLVAVMGTVVLIASWGTLF